MAVCTMSTVGRAATLNQGNCGIERLSGVPLCWLDRPVRVAGGWKFFKRRFCEEISLEEPNPVVLEPAELLQRLDAFGNDVDAQVHAYLHDAANDRLTRPMFFDASHEIHVNLYLIRLEFGQEIQARVARAKVIDRKLNAHSPIFVEQRRKM